MERIKARKAENAERSLFDLVFSWSLRDVLSKDLYKDKVCCFISLFPFMILMHGSPVMNFTFHQHIKMKTTI